MSAHRRGFTLIELLVVISIIAILSAIGMVMFSKVQAQARDAKRRSDLKDLQTALELYFSINKAYPSTGGAWYSSEPGNNAAAGDNNGDYIPGLAPTYIRSLPRDPRGAGSLVSVCQPDGWKQAYLYRSDNGSSYALLSHCAAEATAYSNKDPFYDPIRGNSAWKVCDAEPGCSW